MDYKLAINNGSNALHGGRKGFDKRVWDAAIMDDGVRFNLLSADGEEGYPGALQVSAIYSLSDDNTLTLDYEASTDKTTILNLTNHAYFNLAGHGAGKVLDHEVVIKADTYTPVDDETLIPSGEIAPVEGTALDFRTPHRIGARMDAKPKGYDNNYVLDEVEGPTVRVTEPTTGRYIEMETTEPGVQLYTAFFLDDTSGKGGATYGQFGGFCLEAQHYPDSIHHPNFPTTVLHPGETYTQRTGYRFGVV
jgi:aldose 1-epimerase